MNKAEKYKVFYEKKLQSGIDNFKVDGKVTYDSNWFKFVQEIVTSIKEQEKESVEITDLYYTQLFVFDDSALFVSFLDEPHKIWTYTRKDYDERYKRWCEWCERLRKETHARLAREAEKKAKKESESD